jgi:hypothetical protein
MPVFGGFWVIFWWLKILWLILTGCRLLVAVVVYNVSNKLTFFNVQCAKNLVCFVIYPAVFCDGCGAVSFAVATWRVFFNLTSCQRRPVKHLELGGVKEGWP